MNKKEVFIFIIVITIFAYPVNAEEVTLTATITKGQATFQKQFTVNVLPVENLDELAVTKAKQALTSTLVLNGNSHREKILGDLNLVTSLTDHPDVIITWTTSNPNYIALNGSVKRDTIEDKQVNLTALMTKDAKSTNKLFNLIVKKKIAPAVPVAGIVELPKGVEEIVIDNSNANTIQKIEVPETIDQDQEVTLNLESLIDETKEITLQNQELTLTRKTGVIDYIVEIPQGTKISGEQEWNGLITLPTIKQTSEVSIDEGTPEIVIEVGSTSVKLTFDKATSITLPNQAGKSAGFVRDDVFYTIPACIPSQIADPDTLPDEGDCYTTSGSDLIIWTKHFTKFVSYTPSPTTPTTITTPGGSTATTGGATGTSLKETTTIDFLISQKETNFKIIEGTTKTFTFDNIVPHTLTLNKITTNSATITIASTKKTFTLTLEETIKIDVNDDGSKDLKITLNSIENNIADISLNLYTEPTPTLYTEPTKEPVITQETTPLFSKITGQVVATGKNIFAPSKLVSTIFIIIFIIFIIVLLIVTLISLGGIHGVKRKIKSLIYLIRRKNYLKILKKILFIIIIIPLRIIYLTIKNFKRPLHIIKNRYYGRKLKNWFENYLYERRRRKIRKKYNPKADYY